MAFMDYLERWHPGIAAAIFHVPNEGKRSYNYSKKLKKMGLKSGVSDYILPVSRLGYSLLALEYKTQLPRGDLSDSQRRWLAHMNALGAFPAVAWGIQDAIDIVLAYWHGDEKKLMEFEY